MAEQVGDAFVQLRVRDGQFNNQMGAAENTANKLGATLGRVGTAAVLTGQEAVVLGDGLQNVDGQMIGTAGSAGELAVATRFLGLRLIGLAAITTLITKSIGSFAKNEEDASKFAVVFGKNAKSVGDEMDAFAGKVGRSSNELRALTGNTGDVIKALGFEEDEAAKLSVTLTQLAVDVASFKNESDEDVINSFTRALTGERESLKTLGLVIQEADVEQELFSSGIQKVGGRFTKTQKALATYRLLLKNTTDSQGDAERTAGSLTNRMRFVGGSFKDTGIEIGRVISQVLDLPAVFGGVGTALQSVSGFLRDAFSSEVIITFTENVKGVFAEMLNTAVSAFKSLGILLTSVFDDSDVIFQNLLDNERERQSISLEIQNTITENIKRRLGEVEDAKKKETDKFIAEEKRKLGFIGFEARAREATIQIAASIGQAPKAGQFGGLNPIRFDKNAERNLLEAKKQTRLLKELIKGVKNPNPVIL